MEQPPIPPGGEQPPFDPTDQLAGSGAAQHHDRPIDEQAPLSADPELSSLDTAAAVVGAVAAAEQVEQGRPTAGDTMSGNPFPERRSNKDILSTARQTIDVLADVVRRNENLPGMRELAEHFITSDDRQAPAGPFDRALEALGGNVREVIASAADGAVFRLWSRSKVVYAMDELLLGYLSESSASRVPTQVLRALPHADPYLLLPRPDLTDAQTAYYRTHIGVPLGAFVFGRYNQAQQLCSTADDKREDLGLMFIGFIERADGTSEPITLRCTIPLSGQTFTVEDAVTATVGKFNFNEHLAEDDPGKLEAWLRTYVAQAFNSLLYVCTEQPDIEVYQPGSNRPGGRAKSRAQRRPRPADIERVVKLGFRMGPALHQARQQSEQGRQGRTGSAEQTGRRVRPHQKKGHYRTYWTGAGRVEPTLKWIAPFWVNDELLDPAGGPGDVVVRPVRKRK